MPKTWLPSGSQVLVVKKLPLSWEIAGIARMIRKMAMPARSARTNRPAPRVTPLKTASPRRRALTFVPRAARVLLS
ncbi:MAG: hypothetical protein ABJA34_08270 [Pseudonocardiales bacterium]